MQKLVFAIVCGLLFSQYIAYSRKWGRTLDFSVTEYERQDLLSSCYVDGYAYALTVVRPNENKQEFLSLIKFYRTGDVLWSKRMKVKFNREGNFRINQGSIHYDKEFNRFVIFGLGSAFVNSEHVLYIFFMKLSDSGGLEVSRAFSRGNLKPADGESKFHVTRDMASDKSIVSVASVRKVGSERHATPCADNPKTICYHYIYPTTPAILFFKFSAEKLELQFVGLIDNIHPSAFLETPKNEKSIEIIGSSYLTFYRISVDLETGNLKSNKPIQTFIATTPKNTENYLIIPTFHFASSSHDPYYFYGVTSSIRGPSVTKFSRRTNDIQWTKNYRVNGMHKYNLITWKYMFVSKRVGNENLLIFGDDHDFSDKVSGSIHILNIDQNNGNIISSRKMNDIYVSSKKRDSQNEKSNAHLSRLLDVQRGNRREDGFIVSSKYENLEENFSMYSSSYDIAIFSIDKYGRNRECGLKNHHRSQKIMEDEDFDFVSIVLEEESAFVPEVKLLDFEYDKEFIVDGDAWDLSRFGVRIEDFCVNKNERKFLPVINVLVVVCVLCFIPVSIISCLLDLMRRRRRRK